MFPLRQSIAKHPVEAGLREEWIGKKEARPLRPRHQSPWLPVSHVPRPVERWLYARLYPQKWRDSRPRIDWLIRGRQVAKELGCRVVYDPRLHWRESRYVRDYNDHGPAALVGGAGDPLDACAALLHELGHHLLLERNHDSKRKLPNEEVAWQIAHELAARHRLPLNPRIRRVALASYRYTELSTWVPGSKTRNRRRPEPRSWRLEESRRSAEISTGFGIQSIGKKGKRHAKRHVKRLTARAQRRKPIEAG